MPSGPSTLGRTATRFPTKRLWQAVNRGDLKELSKALEQGAQVNAVDDRGRDALFRVAATDRPALRITLLDFLLDAGADPCRRSLNHPVDRCTAWSLLTTLNDSAPATHFLERCPELIAFHEQKNLAPLMLVMAHGHQGMVPSLLDQGASPTFAWPCNTVLGHLKSSHPQGPLSWALRHGFALAIDALLTAQATLDDVDNMGAFELVIPLAQASDALNVLLRRNVAMTSDEQQTIVVKAVHHGWSWPNIERLIAAGADPLGLDPQRGSALHAAVGRTNLADYVDHLLDLGLDPALALPEVGTPVELLQRSSQVDRPDVQAALRRLEKQILWNTAGRTMCEVPVRSPRARL